MKANSYIKDEIKVADEAFLIVALLQRENPARAGFSVAEIIARAERENITGKLRPGVKQHVYEHAVANLKPGNGKYKMLYRTTDGKVRLLSIGDEVHPARTGKIWPEVEEVPARYRELIAWAKKQYGTQKQSENHWLDGVRQMRGLGKKMWAGEDPDAYVAKLREEWG